MKRKLIEHSLPLDAINAASAREKSIRHGHPSTLHLWWARRPLAACRAVLFAQLVDDPSAHPEEFPTVESQDRERERLFGIIEELVKWENTTNEEVLNAARAEILKSTDGDPPPILDPFAGGGSIPLEAQRLGLEAHASDLNPVAVLINKALIEIPPRWADMPPVHPDAERRTHWRGAEGLAEDVRLYGKWMRDEAERRIGHLYPKAKLEDGSEADVIAWIWARTVTCPNPACGATMPLLRSLWINKRSGEAAWLQPNVRNGGVWFDVKNIGEPPFDGTIKRSGATCLVCGSVAPLAYIRAEGRQERIGSKLVAATVRTSSGRGVVEASAEHSRAAEVIRPAGLPDIQIPNNPRYLAPPLYGMTRWVDLFTDRQRLMLSTYADLVADAQSRVVDDIRSLDHAGHVDRSYASDLAVYLAFLIDKLADTNSALCSWQVQPPRLRATFGRQALPMVWDFAEANPFGGAAGDMKVTLRSIAEVLERLPTGVQPGRVTQGDARYVGSSEKTIATDPPYYDNIGYSDLADFFYVWLRAALSNSADQLLDTVLTPKEGELIATPYRHEGSSDRAGAYFQRGFVEAFAAMGHQRPEMPMTFFYAFRQAESDDVEGLGSTGWSTMLEGLLQAGWAVTATWPMRTEMMTRNVGRQTNALASSVVLACRPRPADAGLTDRQGFVRELGERLPSAVGELQKANIAPVDLRQAAIGPGMGVFSKYSKVVEPDGSQMRVRTALGLINQALDEVLGEQEAAFDAETRWAVQWFSQFFDDEGPYGTAESLAVAMNVSVEGMRQAGVVESGGGKVRLLGRDEYPDGWDPTLDDRVPVWEACQHLVKRLESEGEAAAGVLLDQLGGLGESAQLLAYRLYTVCEKSRPGLAGPYNALVASWPEIQRHARHHSTATPPTPNQQQTLDT